MGGGGEERGHLGIFGLNFEHRMVGQGMVSGLGRGGGRRGGGTRALERCFACGETKRKK